MTRETPPFRADHVGSLLRPPALLEARARHAAGEIDRRRAARRRGRRHPRRRADAGGGRPADGAPTASSAGRRGTWTSSTSSAGSTRTDEKLMVHFRNAAGRAGLRVRGAEGARPGHAGPSTIFGDAFRFLRETVTTGQTPKLTIPSPSMVHYRGGRAAIDQDVYPELDAFWADLTAAYAEEVRRLGELGCTYLQLDDTSLAYLNDPAAARRCSPSRAATPSTSTSATSATSTPRCATARTACASPRTCAGATSGPRGRPRAATTSWPRRCSPSSTSTGSSSSTTTSAPAGSSRCASCPPGKQVVLGLVTTKRGALEDKDDAQAPHRRGRRSTSRSTSSASRRSAASPRRSRATRSPTSEEVAKLRLIVETAAGGLGLTVTSGTAAVFPGP